MVYKSYDYISSFSHSIDACKKNFQRNRKEEKQKMEAIEKSDFLNNIFMTLFPF